MLEVRRSFVKVALSRRASDKMEAQGRGATWRMDRYSPDTTYQRQLKVHRAQRMGLAQLVVRQRSARLPCSDAAPDIVCASGRCPCRARCSTVAQVKTSLLASWLRTLRRSLCCGLGTLCTWCRLCAWCRLSEGDVLGRDTGAHWHLACCGRARRHSRWTSRGRRSNACRASRGCWARAPANPQ